MSKILNLKEYVIARTFSPWQSHEIASHSFAMTEQRGRSMVEMLGVLAIIGVLSVAGIAGYTNAMRQYRTNEIVNAISTLYVMGMAQNQGQGTGTMNYSDIGTNPSGVTGLVYTNKTITATITDENDCKMVKNKLGDKAGECTATTEAYTLSVSFGQEEEEEEFTEPGAPCKSLGKYFCKGGSYGAIYKCRDDIIDDGAYWLNEGVYSCCKGCKDRKLHDNIEDTCIDGETCSEG